MALYCLENQNKKKVHYKFLFVRSEFPASVGPSSLLQIEGKVSGMSWRNEVLARSICVTWEVSYVGGVLG